MFSAIKEEEKLNLSHQSEDKFHVESDDAEEFKGVEKKFKEKYQVSGKPLASNFLQKRLQRGQKFFDSGDYNMAIANKNKPKLPCQVKDLSDPTRMLPSKLIKDSLPNITSSSYEQKPEEYSIKDYFEKDRSSNSGDSTVKCKANHDELKATDAPNIIISPQEDILNFPSRKSSLEPPQSTSEVTGHVIATPDNVPARKASIPLSTVLLKAQQPHQLTFPFHHPG